jgi:hypothetical protein
MPRAKKPKLSFAERYAKQQEKYGTYDTSNGFGTPKDWKSAFEQTVFSAAELEELLGQDDPLHIMGFTEMPDKDALRKAYGKLMFKNHPDYGGSEDAAKRIIAAYQTLKARL